MQITARGHDSRAITGKTTSARRERAAYENDLITTRYAQETTSTAVRLAIGRGYIKKASRGYGGRRRGLAGAARGDEAEKEGSRQHSEGVRAREMGNKKGNWVGVESHSGTRRI